MYLSKILIKNYKGIESLEVSFSPKVNIIIGENGRCKSALIDAIRLLYNLGEPFREITVSNEDFFEMIVHNPDGSYSKSETSVITIAYEFRGLSDEQKGAFYEYMVVDSLSRENDFARIELQYKKDKKYPLFSYSTGNIEGQKADSNTFRLFQHYYLSALRDSTKDLLNTRNNILGRVIRRLVERNSSETEIANIVKEANEKLLDRDEVKDTKANINTNLHRIFKFANTTKIGVHIEQSKIEYIVNIIKPFLPHDKLAASQEGFQLWQNSLGFNNLIYIATVLGDINERIIDDSIPHYSLLIEEPEAHIHPQLQLSLYNFLKEAIQSKNSQLFVTSHSPTLTSKVPLENLILLEDRAYKPLDSFKNREAENLIQDTRKGTALTKEAIDSKRKQLERFLDVTKSQLFFARGCLFVEGISEELLLSAFCLIKDFALEDYRIELVNVDGTSFYPFLFLFNSTDPNKRLPKKVAIITDGDHFPSSKYPEYNISELIKDSYSKLMQLHQSIYRGTISNRIANLVSISNSQPGIVTKNSMQTLEYELCLANIEDTKTLITENFFFKYVKEINPTEVAYVESFINTISGDIVSDENKQKIAILLWKCLPSKADFSQDFSIHITEHLSDAKLSFKIPQYINEALIHLMS